MGMPLAKQGVEGQSKTCNTRWHRLFELPGKKRV